jgi:hypothetical protein
MKKGLSIAIEWWDEDVVIFVFNASNGIFCGAVEVYLHHDALEQLAKNLSGFPRDAKDQREIDLGAFSIREAGGGVQMRFVCVDAACHPAVDVKLQIEQRSAFGEMQSVVLRIPLEAAAIDNFVTQLRQFKTAKEQTITLPMAQ